MNSIYFTDANHGVAVGGNVIIKTTNGSLQSVNSAKIVESEYEIFPNPADDRITIVNTDHIPGTISVSISDCIGNKVLTRIFSNLSTDEIHLGHLSKGIYFVKIQSGTRIYVRKLIIC
jgi:hypothetical protein